MSEVSGEPPSKKGYFGSGQRETCTSNTTSEMKNEGEEIDFTKDTMTNDDFIMSEDKCTNFVSPGELERLKEFKILDEVKSNDEDSDRECHSSDEKSDEIPDEEVEKMLDEALPDKYKRPTQPREKPYTTRQKIILEEKGVNHLEVLPLDWVMVRHHSGMPVYIHRPSRVCTLARPYFLGKGNTRRHDIPISAIPCLAYKKALEEEAEQKKIDQEIQEQIRTGSWKNDLEQNAKQDANKASNKLIEKENSILDSNNTAKNVSECPLSQTNSQKQNEKVLEDTMKDLGHLKEQYQSESSRNGMINNYDNSLENASINKSVANNAAMLNKDAVDQVSNEDLNSNNTTVKTESGTNKKDGNGMEINHLDDQAVNGDEGANNVAEGRKSIPPSRKPIVLPGGIVMAPPRVESVESSWKNQLLNQKQVNDYCSKLFQFKTINVMHFKSWGERHKYTKARKALQYPSLPEGTKFITIPPPPGNDKGRGAGRPRVLSVSGRSCLSVFHEYVRRVLDAQPEYHFHQLENSASPYQATVLIGGMQYGVGTGSSKRLAKAAAARASMKILIPEVGDQLEPEAQKTSQPDLSFFEEMGVEDARVPRVCAASGEPSPYAVLRTCLHRNFGAADHQVKVDVKKLECQKIEVTMQVGKHTAVAVANNMKTAKQQAAQSILQALHPHVKSWGSLLRLYGSRSMTSCKQKKLEEQQITLLQEKARRHRPNTAVLDKLRSEMAKLRERDEALVPIGTLLVTDQLPSHSGSNLNNVDL